MFKTISITEYTQRNVKKEFECLFLMGVLERANVSEWGARYFVQPKPKANLVNFLSDYIYLNNQLKRRPYSMPKINEILLKL